MLDILINASTVAAPITFLIVGWKRQYRLGMHILAGILSALVVAYGFYDAAERVIPSGRPFYIETPIIFGAAVFLLLVALYWLAFSFSAGRTKAHPPQ